jgi:hypothetical protein
LKSVNKEADNSCVYNCCTARAGGGRGRQAGGGVEQARGGGRDAAQVEGGGRD